jgi:hypothetical protein
MTIINGMMMNNSQFQIHRRPINGTDKRTLTKALAKICYSPQIIICYLHFTNYISIILNLNLSH